jgi:hypothetical protein
MRLRLLSRGALLLGICLTALQIGIACSLPKDKSVGDSYMSLCNWDCDWYREIVTSGYHSPVPPVAQRKDVSDVAFFPGYPYLARGLHLGLGIEPKLALLIVAQLFCVLFWAALWSVLQRWAIPKPIAGAVVMAIFVHPATFFLVAGYSESLFLSTLLLFILYSSSVRPRDHLSASLSGFALSATRIIGIPAAGFPVIRHIVNRLSRSRTPSRQKDNGEFFHALSITAVAVSGALLFFYYCHEVFGRYDFYMDTQKIGWGIYPDYGAILNWKNFGFRYPMDQFATFASAAIFLSFVPMEIAVVFLRRPTGISKRLPLYLLAVAFFFITLSGLESVRFQSMIRYTLPWYILLGLCFAHLATRVPRPPRPIGHLCFGLLLAGAIAAFWMYQLPHFRDFLGGNWFA